MRFPISFNNQSLCRGDKHTDACANETGQHYGHLGLRGGMQMSFRLFYDQCVADFGNPTQEQDYRRELGDHR